MNAISKVQALNLKVGLKLLPRLPPMESGQIRRRLSPELLRDVEKAWDSTKIPFAYMDEFSTAAYEVLGPSAFVRFWHDLNHALFDEAFFRIALSIITSSDPLRFLQGLPGLWALSTENAGQFEFRTIGKSNAAELWMFGVPLKSIERPVFPLCWNAAFTVLLARRRGCEDVKVEIVELNTRAGTMRARISWAEKKSEKPRRAA